MRIFIGIIGLLVLGGLGYYLTAAYWPEPVPQSYTTTEEGFDEDPSPTVPQSYTVGPGGQYTIEELAAWERPAGPPRVALQVGHLDNEVVPDELSGLTRNGSGATYGSYNERDAVARITELVSVRLAEAGVEVTILPVTVPPGYVADAFVSIHADGNPNNVVSGYKIAGPRRDYSGRSEQLVEQLYDTYGEATGLQRDPSISRRMTAYYAFNWPRYVHAIHPYTPAAIVETGFITNAGDRRIIIDAPERAAAGIADGILAFLELETPPDPPPLAFAAPTLPVTGTVECAPLRAEERRNPEDDHRCVPSIRGADGRQYLLLDEEQFATTTFPYPATVDGRYRPIQTLSHYFWFDYEAAGIITDAEVVESR